MNRLINEKSPYLLQHAHNPVDWYPWGPEAFQRAHEQGRPIFLSVGYSTCHWCHVMERESFENETIAALLNEYFVPVKVDREERPDVDRVYMTSLQAMGQDGGWPMSMFLTPDLKPFYGGTYFPPESRYGRAGFPDILRRVHEIWASEREKVEESANGIFSFLSDTADAAGGRQLPGAAVLNLCFEQLERSYDDTAGGFGKGAKFPRPAALGFLLRYYHRTRRPEPLQMVETTLQAMARGGICDHVGGGFHRYTVDRAWRVPHFEKMLYDQAQLAEVYLDLFQLTGNTEYASIVRSILEYVRRDLTDPQGGFFTAEDADSPVPERPEEQGEGAFYLWTRTELIDLLGENDGRLFCLGYGVEAEGNAPFDPQHEFTGKNILYVAESPGALARNLGKDEREVEQSLSRARARLLEARSKRPRPLRDDKILTSWNGLMLGAFARAGAILDDSLFLHTAERAADFLLTRMVDPVSGTLRRRFRKEEARFEGHLDDYAFLVAGLLQLFQASGAGRWLEQAVRLTEGMIAGFADLDRGGFFDSPGTDPSVLVRLKEQYDGAEPTGNSVAAMNLLTLAGFTGKDEWRRLAERTITAFAGILERQPVMMPNMAAALGTLLSPPSEIVIAGPPADPVAKAMVKAVREHYLPGTILLLLDPAAGAPDVVVPELRKLAAATGKTVAYLCENYACNLPTSDPDVVAGMLERKATT
ncbi:MAG TPA: thioredoxin domain-containing protein [Bacteroidota bacterium]